MNAAAGKWQLPILGAHPFRWDTSAAKQFRNAIGSVVTEAEKGLQTEHPSVHLQLRFPDSPKDVLAQIESGTPPAFAIIDVSELDEELALLAGYLQGMPIPAMFLCRSSSVGALGRLGIRATDPRVIEYSRLDELAGTGLARRITQAISPSRIQEEVIYDLWFPRETQTIWIVCPTIHEAGEFATPESPNYTYLDNLGDTDALLHVMVFLSRYYPRANIEKFSSEDLPPGHTHSNLVVIGGPGCDGEISNRICRVLMSTMRSRVSYSDECDRMLVGTGLSALELTADLSAELHTKRRDYGYFARFPNPFNEDATAVLLSGIHTTGVLGAASAFCERREALRNFHAVYKSSANPGSFECHFEVNSFNQTIQVPRIEPANIVSLGANAEARADRVVAPEPVPSEPSSSLTVLYVAGDRGGSQSNQIQISRELDSIQDALLACKYHGAISLANPVLAATRQKLVRAYRTNAGIIHFAGHGDDRSLSLIDDQGILVSATEVIAEQLAGILKNYPQRVRLCILNTCNSAPVAEHLVRANAVDAAIGWNHKIADMDAVAFSGTLYSLLGDGVGLRQAFDLASQVVGSGRPPTLSAIDGINREQALVSSE